MNTPILFLDLDGTVRYNFKVKDGFINSPDEVEIFDGVLNIIKSYKEKGWRVVSVSNQGGIALRHVSENVVARTMQETNRMCASLFDLMRWCTHHPDAEDEESSICMCRKPRIGMIVSSMIELTRQYGEVYRPYSCLMVGDREEDRLCAENANMPFKWASQWREDGVI